MSQLSTFDAVDAEEPHAEVAEEHGAAKPQPNPRPLVLDLESERGKQKESGITRRPQWNAARQRSRL